MSKKKKRIELHCHSKFGGRATMYPREIISYLSNLDMPAFAITDDSNIGAFSEFEKMWETGRYNSRPIYGVEIVVEGICDSEVDYISVLIKNECGKKTLYKLISENESEGDRLLFQFKKLVENREGLLLGSGTEDGRLYKSALRGIGENELRKVIAIYDYVEILPGKKYEEINKKIVDICDELKIPVVAISDARYSDEAGRKALKIMKHWNKENEHNLGNYFLSTEEMLECFDYLPQEKAYEIVIENTHFIANMCETIAVCPKENCFPIVLNAGERLRKKCYALLRERYLDNRSIGRERLDWELSALEKTKMESYVLQISELLNKSSLKADDISCRGTAAGSIVAYLLGITNIDPLEYGLEPETIFGINGRRTIDIDINIPADRQIDVISKVGEIEGIGKYVWAGTIRCISESHAQSMIEQYMADTGASYDEDMVYRLRHLIEGNYLERGKQPDGILVFPERYKYNEVLPTTKIIGGFETTYFDYYSVDRSFLKFDLLKNDSLEMLTKLEKITGVKLSTIPVDDTEVLALFETDSDGNVSGCDGLPEFESEYIRKIISIVRPKSFDDLVKISAISHGEGLWEDSGEILVTKKGLGIEDIIATRDDVFEYNLSFGLDRITSYEIAEAVRKGTVARGQNTKWRSWKKKLLEAGAPEWYVWTCERIRYLIPRAHAISNMFMNMRLGWFKVHYPEKFNKTMMESDRRSR